MSTLSRRLAILERQQAPTEPCPADQPRRAISDLFTALAVAQGLDPDRAPDEAMTCAMAERIKAGGATPEDEEVLAQLPRDALDACGWPPGDFVVFLKKTFTNC